MDERDEALVPAIGQDEPVKLLHATKGRDFAPLLGREPRTVDDKGRVVLPAGAWRDAFAGTAYIGLYKGGSIALWPLAQLNAVLDLIAAQERIAGIAMQGATSAFRSGVFSTPVDSHGRCTLPPALREHLGIRPGAQLTIHGEGDRLEVRPIADADPGFARYLEAVELFDHL